MSHGSYTVVGAAATLGILGIMLALAAVSVKLAARRRARMEPKQRAAIEAEFRPYFDALRDKED